MRRRTIFTSCVRLSIINTIAVAFLIARSNAFVDEEQVENNIEVDIEARRGAFLSTSGSFTLSSGGGNAAGNSEDIE